MMGKMEIRSPPGSRPRDGRHCDLCGCSQPAVRCDKCGCQIFCLSCDDMYHRHPKRRFHLRKAVDPTPVVPQARPNLPMKVSHLNTTNPADPSKMPLPPPRKKKSLFSSFRKPSPSSENSPPLPKKEYSWTDRLGSIKKFMSNRPLPPLPTADDSEMDSQPATNGQVQRGDLSFIHKRTDERPPQLPERSPRSPDFPGMNHEKENRIPSLPPHLQGQIRNGSLEPNANHMNQNHEFNSTNQNQWNNQVNHQNDAQAFGTLNRQRQFMPPGVPGYPGGMHQSSSATDLHSMHNAEAVHGAVPPHYPHYPMNPHMPPHYPYPMYPGYPNYPQYFGNSFMNLSNPPTSEGDFSDSESSSRHSSKRHAFRKRAKRSQSVVMDRMAFQGQFYPFGPYPGYGPWGAPMPIETPPSPASSLRSLNRTGRTRRRKKGTSEDDDEELSETSSPMSRPKSSSSDPKEHPRAPLATQTTSSEDESDDEANKRRKKINTIRRQSEPVRSPSPAINKKVAKLKKSSSKQSDSDTPESSANRNDRRPSDPSTEQQPVRQPPVQQQFNAQRSPTPQQPILRESPVAQTAVSQPQTSKSASSTQPGTWECRHCTFINPIENKICQVCCKTATPRTETPVSSQSRPPSSSAKNRKDSVGSENEYFVPDEINENEISKKEKQDMASLNSALDEAEKQISKGLEELMKLKEDIDTNPSKDKSNTSEIQSKRDSEDKPKYKSSGRMRTSILDKLNLNKPQTTNSSVSTSTETQTDQNGRTIDKIIEARRLSNSSTASETYNSPLAQSPDLERGYLGSKQKRDSSCQTQQDSIAAYLEKRKAAEEAFLGRPINNFGFSYGDRMDMMTSPVPSMYDRFYGGGYGPMQRSHSRASLFTGRMNDFGPVDYGPGPGYGYGPTPMYRSVSRGSLTGDYPDGRVSGLHNMRKPDFYLSMEELVERRCQDNINSIRAQGLELVRMIREAEQQGFNADDIQVALTHCGKQNPLEWLQENWRNMVDSVVTLSTNYGNDKKENDIGLLSENEARDALRLHKGNIWAAVTECVEGRQRKYLELNARGNFPRQDIVDALTSSDGDVEMAYAKLTKSTVKPFLMRIWGQGEGAQNQDGAQPMAEDFRDRRDRYLKDDTLNNDDLSDDLWSEDEEAVDWDDEEDYEEERGDIEDLRTCQEDLPSNTEEIRTPESEKSDYCDAFSVHDRNVSSPSDDIFFVIPEAKPEKKKGFLSKLVALRKDSKERSEADGKERVSSQQNNQLKEDSTSQKIPGSSEQKNGGTLNTLKNKFSAIKDTVTGGTKSDKKMPTAQVERRTIIVRGQLEHESLSNSEEKSSPIHNSSEKINSSISKSDKQNNQQIKETEETTSNQASKSTKADNNKNIAANLNEKNQIKAEHESLSNSEEKKSSPVQNSSGKFNSSVSKSDEKNNQQIKQTEEQSSNQASKSTKADNSKNIAANLNEKNQIEAETFNIKNESKGTDLKKGEDKNSQRLSVRLKFAKQNRSSFDTPGPSGINKESLVQSATKKEGIPIQSQVEMFPQNHIKSNLIPEKEVTIDKTNAEKISNIKKLENYDSKIEKLNNNNQQIPQNTTDFITIKSNEIQNNEALQSEKIPEVPSQNLSKESKVATTTKSSQIDTLANKSPISDISEMEKEVSLKSPTEQKIYKKPALEIDSKTSSENTVLLITSTEELKKNRPNSGLVPKEDDHSDNHITKKTDQKITSEINVSTSVSNVLESSSPSELKMTNIQKENTETTLEHPEKLASKTPDSENKTSIAKGSDKKSSNRQESENSKVNNVKSDIIKEEIKRVPQEENKTETSAKISDSSKSGENSKKSETIENQKVKEKSQKSLVKSNKTEVTVSTEINDVITKSNENVSSNIDHDKTVSGNNFNVNETHKESVPEKILKADEIQNISVPQEIFKTDETQKSSAVEEILKTNEIHKTTMFEEVTKSELHVPSNHDIQNKDVSIVSENNIQKETSITELLDHHTQSNLEKSKVLPENKSISVINEDPDLSATSSNKILETSSEQIILENSNNNLKLDKDKAKEKLLSEENKSEINITSETNTIQNLDIVNKETSLINTEHDHIINLPQTSTRESNVVKNQDNVISSIQSMEPNSESCRSVTETQNENKDNISTTPLETNNLVSVVEIEKSEQATKNKDEHNTKSTAEISTNLVPQNNLLPGILPENHINTVDNDKSLKNNMEISNKNINEEHKDEVQVNKITPTINESAEATNSVNKNSESGLKSSLEKTLIVPSETVRNSGVSVEIQEKVATIDSPSMSEANNIPENVEQVSDFDPTRTTVTNSVEVINKEMSNETKLQEPVFSKEYPNKNIAEVQDVSIMRDNNDITTPPITDNSVISESLPTTSKSDNSGNLKVNENVPDTNISASDKVVETPFNTNNVDNTPSMSRDSQNITETIIKQGNVSIDLKTAINKTSTESSVTEDKSLSTILTESSKTPQISSNDNITSTSTLANTVLINDIVNDSAKEISTLSNSTTAPASVSSNTNIPESSKTVPSLTSTTDSDNSQSAENSISQLTTSASNDESLTNDTKSPSHILSEQHSKTPESIAANSFTSTSTTNSSSSHTFPRVQHRKFQRTTSDDTSESEEDTDTDYSNNSSRRGSLLPSPVDTLRSRFEGLASGATVRGGPIRPASPFRRMSFNSRKQVIALERKKDTSTDKPWYHKIDPVPVKIVQPKRSIKQQLEMERKVRKMVADRKCRTYKKAEIIVQLMDMNFDEEEAIQAANECSTLEQAISYLQQECLLCAGHFPVSQIISMTHCEHRACRECIRAYFTVQIRDRTILDLICPFCNEPDVGDEDVAQDYFNHLDIMLKKLVDIEIHELFQRKLRDRVLMKDPNFRWCSQCSSGFIAMPNLKRLICPDCNAVTCASCRRLWEKEHQGISCEAFAAMKDATDPEAQAAGLAKMLTEDGISCPSCHFRYALAKGGCMHFRCIQCQHDFCSGCSRPFKMGQKCGVSEFCAKLGLHAHHPRNCLFYLRDKEPEDLQKLLDMNDIKYNREPPDGMEIKSTCQVMEQKETADGMVDDNCGKEVQDGYAGLCRVHYVEYLGQLVNKHKVDPIQIFDNDDLELVLKRANIRLPPKRYRENDAQYREKLIKVIQEELPLDRMDGS